MTEICLNKLIVSGDYIRDFCEKARSPSQFFSMQAMLPVSSSNKYNLSSLRKSYWGCYDDCFDGSILSKEVRCVCYEFKTKHSIPFLFVQNISKIYPFMKFSLYYLDYIWAGKNLYFNGELLFSDEWRITEEDRLFFRV